MTEAEEFLRELAAEITDPAADECLLCYVFRMLTLGCRGLRWARRYRDLRAPAATALERRLGSAGGYCDCEIFWNAYELRPELMVSSIQHDRDGEPLYGDPEYPDPMPACRGVRRGSTKPCSLWRRQYRYGYRRW